MVKDSDHFKWVLSRLLELTDDSDFQTGIMTVDSLCSIYAYSGMVEEITVEVMTILLNLVNNDETQAKYWLLEAISCPALAGEISRNVDQRLYDMMVKHLELFKFYLHHPRSKYRIVAGHILHKFSYHVDLIAPWLCDRILVEENLDVRQKLFRNLIYLLRPYHYEPEVQNGTKDYLTNKLSSYLHSQSVADRYRSAVVLLLVQRDESGIEIKHIISYCVENAKALKDIEFLDLDVANAVKRVFGENKELHKAFPNLSMKVIQEYMDDSLI